MRKGIQLAGAKSKSKTDPNKAVSDAARAERRLLRDEERAAQRFDIAKVRLAKAEDRLTRAQERFAQRQAAFDVASSELLEAQQLRAAGPATSEDAIDGSKTGADSSDDNKSAPTDEPNADQ